MDESATGLTGVVEYRTDLFTSATIARLIAHFQTLLAGIVANPEVEIAQLPLLTMAEQQQFHQWNHTAEALPLTTVMQQFEHQASNTPDHVAVMFEQQSLTYHHLNQRINQLAHYLSQHLSQPCFQTEPRIGICLERSPELLITLLAVLKAGAAYVPLDPSYPRDRLNFMAQDAAVALIVTQSNLLDCLPDGVPSLCLDQQQAAIAQQSTENPTIAIAPNRLAYLIYTSGSTGTPKGVQVLHQGLTNLLHHFQTILKITPHDRGLAVTTIAFDIAALELFLPLISGAQVVIASRAVATDAAQLELALTTHHITFMQATPATWRLLLNAGWQGKSDLQILSGGESLDSPLAEQLLTKGCALWNLYGPTETTIWSAAHRVQSTHSATIPIGHAIANTQFYVLDEALQPVPIGIPGQLYIGGIGVARGYWNRPDLNAERFIPCPSVAKRSPLAPLKKGGTGSEVPLFKRDLGGSARLYQTGDRVRFLPDGTLEYLGRLDDQIKLRGYRIELGEIAARLQQHPDVNQAVVLLDQESPDRAHLVAYFTPANLAVEALRSFLATQLPVYMLPSHWVGLDTLPLTPNGKLDRKALPISPPPHLSTSPPPHLPTSPTQELLANIWSTLLHQPQIRITDNFFELGGHSLLATQMVSQIRRMFQRELPLRSVFETPTLAALADAIANTESTSQPPIRPSLSTTPAPLSFAQHRFWVLAQLEPNSPSYNIPLAVRIRGQLDPAMLCHSFEAVIQRHAVLRTGFQAVTGQPVPMISPIVPLSIPKIDLGAIPPELQVIHLQNLAQTEARRPFDLALPPLLRVTVIQLQPNEQVVLLTVHHIVADAWSMNLLVQEVAQNYEVLHRGQPIAQPTLAVQYADFAAWQRLQTQQIQTDLDYWQQQLAGIPALLDLSTDRPRPAVQQFQGAVHRFTLDAELAPRLRQFSQQTHSTLFMMLLTGLSILLHRYSGSADIAIGSPIANRPQADLEALIGCFANTLVFRTDLRGNPTVMEVIQRVRTTAMAAYAHQAAPFEQVIEAVQPERSLSHAPLFQVMLVLQNLPLPELTPGEMEWQLLESQSGTAKFDLTWMVTETPTGIAVRLEYDTALFDATTIVRLSNHFESLLQAIVTTPDQPIATLPLLSEPELHQLLVEWNHTQRDYASGICLHELVAAQVERTPAAIAVIDPHQSLTYADLNAKANQLAHYLQSLGVLPDVPVGLCLACTCDLLVGILGILKAGGAYVPIDPTYPIDRLAFMLTDAAVSVLVTQRSLLSQLPETTATIVCVDSATLSDQPTTNPIAVVTADHLAYLIYTSGSTGVPKGVAIAHRSPVALVQWAQETYTSSQLSGVLASTSVCFDLSVFELFVPLCTGGTVILADTVLDLTDLPAAAVTLINTVPSAARELLRLKALPSNVHTINLAGEALSGALVQQLYQQPQIDAVFNLYGPSEDTTYSTAIQLPRSPITPSIGRPIANTQAYILDQYLQPVPIGVVGELYLGGAGLARGYWQRPELTAERFIPNPFGMERSPLAPALHAANARKKGETGSEVPLIKGDLGGSARLYKTGDRARYRPNGEIEFLGRLDHQVKLRGFRIELGEIEATLDRHPAIAQSVVTVREQTADHAQLVAYWVMAQPIDPDEIRQFLATQLPAYMIPTHFVCLDQLPLTSNGKLDRKALPAPDRAALDRLDLELPTAPRTLAEQQLVTIWQTLLGRDNIGINDNFFALGGDSILAIQAIAQANQVGLKLTPRQVFQAQTIAQLAAIAGTTPTIVAEQGIVTGSVPLTPIQHWFFEQNLQHPHHWNQSVFLTVQTPLQPGLVRSAIQALLHHHDALRSRFHRTPNGWQQTQFAPKTIIPFIHIDLSHLAAAEAATAIPAIATELQASLNLETGEVMRVAYFDRGGSQPGHDRLLLVLHHLVVDGLSWRILLEDLQQAYHQLSHSQPLHLPAKTTAFKTWAEQFGTESPSPQPLSQSGKEAIANWTGDRWQRARSLPIDHPQGGNRMAEVACIAVSLTPAETQALLQEVPAAYHTQVLDNLLTALALTLLPQIDNAPLLLELEGHGRRETAEMDLSRTIGWFTSLFPVVLEVGSRCDFATTIKLIKEQLRQIPDQGISYGRVRYGSDLAIQSHLKSLPQANLRFNYLGQVDAVFSEMFAPAPEFGGFARHPQDDRDIALEINGLVLQNQLRFDWLYSRSQYNSNTIQQWADTYLETLRSLIHHCQTIESGHFTPSDFPQMALSQAELDDLLANL
jgi:amino acid adenylation domain-containing protein/non-ribosomal peptide synthase protein (TIGR01720 family)